jgi:hypothetical protein
MSFIPSLHCVQALAVPHTEADLLPGLVSDKLQPGAHTASPVWQVRIVSVPAIVI